jgi:hypothetical protein
VAGRELLDPDDAAAAPCEMMERGAARRAEPDDRNVDRHAPPVCMPLR